MLPDFSDLMTLTGQINFILHFLLHCYWQNADVVMLWAILGGFLSNCATFHLTGPIKMFLSGLCLMMKSYSVTF